MHQLQLPYFETLEAPQNTRSDLRLGGYAGIASAALLTAAAHANGIEAQYIPEIRDAIGTFGIAAIASIPAYAAGRLFD